MRFFSKFLSISFAVLIVGLLWAKADEKHYVFFDDIDYVYNTQGQIIQNGVDEIYYKPLTTNNIYTPKLLKTGYGDFFSSGKKLTDYDIAVFFMGDRPLQYSVGGHRVVTEIKNMLDAGKRVILIGNGLLYWAFDPNSNQRDQEVQQFFANYFGITQESYEKMITVEGNYYKPFGVKAIQGDPVALGYKKVCNMIHGYNDLEPLPPWRYRPIMTVMNERYLDTNLAKPMEFFTWEHDWFRLDTTRKTDSLVGIRVVGDGYKAVFWSSGFEVAAAAGSMPTWSNELFFAMNWLAADLPKPDPWIVFKTSPLDFGKVPVGDTLIKDVRIYNQGRKPLEIDDMYLEGFAESGIFEIVADDLSLTIPPLEERYVPIRFTPKAEEKYEEYFDVSSNAGNGSLQGIQLVGWGGKKPKPGPELSAADTILDFGTLAPTEIDTLPLVIQNTGIDLLIVQERFYWPNEKKPPFYYVHPEQWPISLYPNESDTTYIKFVPGGKTGVFEDKIGIIPYNANNVDTLWIYLRGESKANAGDASISVSQTSIDLDTIKVGEAKTDEIVIENVGKKVIYINSIELSDDYNEQFKLLDKYDEEISGLPWQLPLAGPLKKRKIKVRFEPREPGVYNADLTIGFIDDNNDPIPELTTVVPIYATATDSSVGVGYLNGEKSGVVKIYPMPAAEEFTIEIRNDFLDGSAAEVFITNELGQKRAEIYEGVLDRGVKTFKVSSADFSSGTYFAIVKLGSRLYKAKILIRK